MSDKTSSILRTIGPNTNDLRPMEDGYPRRASKGKSVHPHGRRHPGGKLARRIERARR